MHENIIPALLVIVGILALLLLIRGKKMNTLKSSLKKLAHSFNELDEQAKLIIKTDLELNKAQEELDKRLNGLDALHKTSRLISTTFDEKEIFRRLDPSLLSRLGFEKYLVMIFSDDGKYQYRLRLGFSPEKAARIVSQIKNETKLMHLLQDGRLFSSINAPANIRADLLKISGTKHFITAPILAQTNMLGIFFAGDNRDTFVLTEGDEELISILADQIGQSLKNARLFEQEYHSGQKMESEVQSRTKQLSSVLEEVQKVSKAKSDFISAVSHELRTPLTSIKGYASILITGKVGKIPDEVKKRLEKINKHSDNLVKLINDLLDISRIESGRAEMNFTKHDILSIVENVQDLLTPQIKQKNIQCVARIDDNIPHIPIDAGQIERVFINLIGNAIKFTPEKGTITITAQCDDKNVTVAIADTGVGIEEEYIPKLFDEFYRVENEINQSLKGSGLGLALAKRIIEAHHGEIRVTSKINEGTTFHFTLPVKS